MININMIAERRARRMRERTTLRFMTLGVFVVLIFAVLLNAEKMFEWQAAAKDKETVTKALANLKPKCEELDKVNMSIAQLTPMVHLLDQVRVSESAWMTILADTSRVTPNDVVLNLFNTSANPDGVTLHIGGLANDERTVGEYMMAIRTQTGWAQNSTLSTVSEQKDAMGRRVHFDLTIPIRNMIGGDL